MCALNSHKFIGNKHIHVVGSLFDACTVLQLDEYVKLGEMEMEREKVCVRVCMSLLIRYLVNSLTAIPHNIHGGWINMEVLLSFPWPVGSRKSTA